ncbi:grpE protein homolog, mitochondrial [Amborella trichopoda]|uniref:GrpE protein homolog n=1 Tax=Amborella trichopoda TaxID=13333 RepID=U5D1I4_AMBTC|nr:grpE protein homolog, mitochondrial [Amborella trichopoda]ERN16294.1 hypothetical protein AMTR_s00063p00196210 [Amborella trichopoda]|eukprot:XP_006854827.1 grpE protein homolog, mitochondrial [Amborella trichopoda]
MTIFRVLPRLLRSGVSQSGNLSSRIHALLCGGHVIPQLERSLYEVSCLSSRVLCHSHIGTFASHHSWFSSSASPQTNQKETSQVADETKTSKHHDKASENISYDKNEAESTKKEGSNGDAAAHPGKFDSHVETDLSKSDFGEKRRKSTKRTAFSDSDAEDELSADDLIKLVAEKEVLLKAKQKEIEKMQEKVLRSYAETENIIERTKRDLENSKKFAVQNFAKSLLDVADNLGRASSVVNVSFSKIDQSRDSVGAVPLLKTLLEGVEMTEKQLSEVLKQFGVQKFEALNEAFDPNRHLAVFQVPDPSKPPGIVAHVLKSGYTLYDRVIRPAEVGVTEAVSNEAEGSLEA